MKKRILIASAMLVSMSCQAESSNEQLLNAAAARLAQPLNLHVTVSGVAHPPGAAELATRPAGMAIDPNPHHLVQPFLAPVQVHIETATQSGNFRTPFGICNFQYAIGQANSGPIQVQCSGGEGKGSGGWVLMQDGSIMVHISTESGRAYNLKL